MTSEREFETLLRSWLDESAHGADAEAVLAAVARGTGHVHPRPGWLVRLGGDPMPATDRRWLNRIVATGIGAAVVLVVAALAIGLFTRPDRSIGPSPLPQATSQPTLTPTPTLPPLDLGELLIADARLVSDTVGWLQTERELYRTTDGGRGWAQVTLPREAIPSATRIVDADTVFLVYGGAPWEVAATHDGGATWVVASIEGVPSDDFAILSTRDGISGTLTFTSDLQVYTTLDGGATWSGPTQGSRPSRGAIGCGKFEAGAGETGVIACGNGKFDNVPFDDLLTLSTDGGQTWLELSYPTDDVSLAGEGKSLAGAPLIIGDQILLAVDNWTGATAIYRSSDLGQTWQFINQIPNWQGPIDFVTETLWVGCSNGSGAACWSTQDGGVTWRERRNEEIGWFGSVTFATVDHGWGIISCPAEDSFRPRAPQCGASDRPVLFETLDGGQTWRQLG
jgi:photosystem II stability/assembly factor-like uncharacterized protein